MSAPTPPAKPRLSFRVGWLPRVVILALPSAFLVAVGFRFFVSTGRDDSHITYWPAYTLARFGEILNYNGERVEQSSSLLHVLLLATFYKLTGVDVVTLGKLSSILAGVGTLLLLYPLVRKLADRATAFGGTMLAAACAYFAYWSFGGMESTLVSFVVVWLVLAFGNFTSPTAGSLRSRSLLSSVLAMIAFALVRPESPLLLTSTLVTACALSWLRFRNNEADARACRSRLLMLLGAAAVVCALVFAFRLTYFGSAFPQPVAAKYGGLTTTTFMNGLRYLSTSVFEAGPGIAALLVAAGLACVALAVFEWRSRRFQSHTVFTLLFVAGFVAFIVCSGGDWMEGGRFLVPFLPLALALVPVALANALRGGRRRIVLALSITVLFLVDVVSALAFARRESFGTRSWKALEVAQTHDLSAYSWFEKRNRVNMKDAPLIAFLNDFLIPKIEAVHPGPVVLMTGQMGMLPYHVAREYFGRVRFIDRRGLCDRTLTDCNLLQIFARDAAGLRMEYVEYFEMRERLEGRCGVPRPDIIFDMGGNTQIVSENGHFIVARHFGKVADERGTGGEVLATGFVAIPDELYATLAVADSTRDASRAR